jgi:DNA-binding response OmpR family regulator
MDKLLSGRRILVVEDEMLMLTLLEDILADAGCESVTGAATIDQAVALIDGQVFDAATLDIKLNGNDSYPVADALAARAIPFVFATGNSVHDIMDGYRDRAVLRKPFTGEQLIEMLIRLLRRRSNGNSRSDFATN